MQKFMVMVNNSLMVRVEAASAIAAERLILDEIYHGMNSAHAFSEREMRGEFFHACVLTCETVSLDELRNLSSQFENRWADVLKIDDQILALGNEIIECQQKILSAMKRRKAIESDRLCAADAAKAITNRLGIKA